MSVIDLAYRTTNAWEIYNQQKRDAESKLYVSGKTIFDNDGAQCLNVTVGENYLRKGQPVSIPNKGLKIPPRSVFVIETEQSIAVPLNMFGLVYGMGENIFRSCIVSPGKIDPGFIGKLKIGFYNGNTESVIMKKGDVIACTSFWDIETALDYPLENYHSEPLPVIENLTALQILLKWLGNNWSSVSALLIALATLAVTIIGGSA